MDTLDDMQRQLVHGIGIDRRNFDDAGTSAHGLGGDAALVDRCPGTGWRRSSAGECHDGENHPFSRFSPFTPANTSRPTGTCNAGCDAATKAQMAGAASSAGLADATDLAAGTGSAGNDCRHHFCLITGADGNATGTDALALPARITSLPLVLKCDFTGVRMKILMPAQAVGSSFLWHEIDCYALNFLS